MAPYLQYAAAAAAPTWPPQPPLDERNFVYDERRAHLLVLELDVWPKTWEDKQHMLRGTVSSIYVKSIPLSSVKADDSAHDGTNSVHKSLRRDNNLFCYSFFIVVILSIDVRANY
ncbi:hypothetical protein PPROV_001104900 [Pycnococcus provasolii]|uniref:Uncharacterized protein n=1 Tax=Pycnococcus provasolii TaxID=41880 RepID=A0A830I3M9_9CHLO|nr:hypothetical protein PPROV_001104900 [Pycnococcus provasolii]